MDWGDIESNWKFGIHSSSWLTRESSAIRLKSDKYHEKFKFLVPCFLWCYSWIRPPEWQQYIMYKWDKKVRKPYPIIPLVAAWMVKWFNDNNGNKGKGKYKKISTTDMFLMWWLAFYKESYYYKQRESEDPNFYRWETPPEVFLLALKDYNKDRFYDISLEKYTQYITKSFFRDRLVEFIERLEDSYANYPIEYSDDGFVSNFNKEHYELYEFFFSWVENFLTSLDVWNIYLSKIKNTRITTLQKKHRAVTKIQYFLKSELRLKEKKLKPIINSSLPQGNSKPFFPEGFEPFFPSVKDAWDILYEEYGNRIDRRLYGIDSEKYSYKLEQI